VEMVATMMAERISIILAIIYVVVSEPLRERGEVIVVSLTAWSDPPAYAGGSDKIKWSSRVGR
jgi:hypothetical protein